MVANDGNILIDIKESWCKNIQINLKFKSVKMCSE